jgi:hypothetical protein
LPDFSLLIADLQGLMITFEKVRNLSPDQIHGERKKVECRMMKMKMGARSWKSEEKTARSGKRIAFAGEWITSDTTTTTCPKRIAMEDLKVGWTTDTAAFLESSEWFCMETIAMEAHAFTARRGSVKPSPTQSNQIKPLFYFFSGERRENYGIRPNGFALFRLLGTHCPVGSPNREKTTPTHVGGYGIRLRAYIKMKSGPVFVQKAGWRGATSEHIPGICKRRATKPDGILHENPSGGASFARGRRWLVAHSPLRGCSQFAALATAKIRCRRPAFHFDIGSKSGYFFVL